MKKNVYLDGMSILSIILSLEPGCHRFEGRIKNRSRYEVERECRKKESDEVKREIWR
jgi:hypothetical protein